MFKKRAHVHHYLKNGMEEGEFHDALEGIKTIKGKYEDLIKQGVQRDKMKLNYQG